MLDPLDFKSLPLWQRWTLAVLVVLSHAALAFCPRPAAGPGEPKQAFVVELLIYAALFVLSDLLRPKPKIENAKPAGIGDFQFPTATEDRVVPLIWGRVKVAGPNVVWYGDFTQEAITERVKTGLFSSTRVVTGFRYHMGVQVALCRGPISALRRMWIGDIEVFSGSTTSGFDVDLPELFGGDDLGSGGFRATFDVFPGSDVQAVSDYLASPALDPKQDAGFGSSGRRTPRYTGTCHLVARQLDVDAEDAIGAYLGNSTSIQPWAFEVERYPALFSGQTSGQNLIGVDANPMNVVYEILTNTEWGMGFPAADIDVGASSSFKEASDFLIDEENGFSMVLDREIQAEDLVQQIMQQIDGYIFLDHRSGKWKVKLARADYDIDDVPEFTAENVAEVSNFARSSWDDTTNQIVVKFTHRENDYRGSFAAAQDMANTQIRGGGTVTTGTVVSAQIAYPGIMDPEVAAQVAWRDLRARSYPLARAEFTVDRTFWDLTPGSVVAWTDEEFGVEKLAMRVTRIDYGRLQKNQMVVTAVQDVFAHLDASYGFPPTTQFEFPQVGLVAYPADEQLAMEAPRAIMVREPGFLQTFTDTHSKVFVAARRQSGETGFDIGQRNDPSGSPIGAFSPAGSTMAFMLIGELNSSLPMAATNPTSTIIVVPGPDSRDNIIESIDDTVTPADIGTYLANLIFVEDGADGEFMFVSSAQATGANVQLNAVYRGALDTPQRAHSAGAKVYMVCQGAGLTDTVWPNTYHVDVELRAKTIGEVYAGVTTDVNMVFNQRGQRPYAAGGLLFNGSGTPFTTPSLEGAGAGLNGFRIDVDWWRRHFQADDELTSLQGDDSNVDASTEYQLEVRADPNGANTLVGSVSAWTTGAGTLQVSRAAIITAAPAGTLLRFIHRVRHSVYPADPDLESYVTDGLKFDVTPTSSLTGQFYLGGGLNDGVSSASYTAAATGTFTLNIGAADTGNIEVNVNGGGFVVAIAAGLTTGTFAATSGNSIVIRRVATGSPDPQFVELKNPSNVSVAYGTFS